LRGAGKGMDELASLSSTVLALEQTGAQAAWLDDLPEELASHAQVLRRLLAEVEPDVRVRALQIQGSLGRGTADKSSDLDIGMVVTDEVWPEIAGEMPALVNRLGEVADDYYQFVPGPENPDVFRAWALLSDGIQIDLLLMPSSLLLGSGPDGRTLLDRDSRLLRTDHPMRVTAPADIAKWAFLCWQNIAEAVKYLERDRPLAAAEWLNSSRQATISCWAAAHGLEYAGYANVAAARLGVSCPWPDGLEKTYSRPEVGAVLASATALADLQERTDSMLSERLGIPPRPLARWVVDRLKALSAARPSPGSP
jgi:predicted nucleotidyltransferase